MHNIFSIISGLLVLSGTIIPKISEAIEQANLLISEVNYSFQNNEGTLNYIELSNMSGEEANIDLENYSLDIETDITSFAYTFEANDLLLESGYLLIVFDEYSSFPLADYEFEEISFTSFFNITISDSTDKLLATLSFVSAKDDSDSIVLYPGSLISFYREGDETLTNTGVNKDDFIRGQRTPLNSALGVANYINMYTIIGQSEYRYPPAKRMVSSLTSLQKDYFMNDESLKATRQRYENWAAAMGDYDPYNVGKTKPSTPPSKKVIVLIVGSFLFLSFGAFFLLKQKNKAKQ